MARERQQPEATQEEAEMRLIPTDQDLVSWYLVSMNLGRRLPVYPPIREIDAIHFYSMPPKDLGPCLDVEGGPSPVGQRQWFFYVRGGAETTRIRAVGDGAAGSWRSYGIEEPIYDEQVLGFKIPFTYYSGSLGRPRRTHWRMQEYRLPHNSVQNAQWVLEIITRGRDYSSSGNRGKRYIPRRSNRQ